jgi:hypothetical protein
MNIIIGCPFSDRLWILDQWIDHVNLACEKADLDPEFVFVVGSGNSQDIDTLISKIENMTIRVVSESERSDIRKWNHGRYEHMAFLRNQLLGLVREKSPDLFLSLDSDILLSPDALVSALDALDKHKDAWAVGLKCYMSQTSRAHPSMGIWSDLNRSRFRRVDSDDIATVDIIMAAKLMKKEAYDIDYVFHRNGEDLGWSSEVKSVGGKFIWDGRVTNKHVMGPLFLDVVDKRAGF